MFESEYESLRTDVIAELGRTCNSRKCGWRAFGSAHDHSSWVSEYAEWLVKLAVLSDLFYNDRATPRSAAIWMRQFPPERLEEIHAQRRAA